MANPASATSLPKELLNTKVPFAQGTADSDGRISVFITHAWRTFFGTFVQKDIGIDPDWDQSVSNPPTQAEVEAIRDQVKLLSQAVGKPT